MLHYFKFNPKESFGTSKVYQFGIELYEDTCRSLTVDNPPGAKKGVGAIYQYCTCMILQYVLTLFRQFLKNTDRMTFIVPLHSPMVQTIRYH